MTQKISHNKSLIWGRITQPVGKHPFIHLSASAGRGRLSNGAGLNVPVAAFACVITISALAVCCIKNIPAAHSLHTIRVWTAARIINPAAARALRKQLTERANRRSRRAERIIHSADWNFGVSGWGWDTRTFTVTGIRKGRFVGDVLAAAQQVALDHRPLVLQLPTERSVLVLQQRIIHPWNRSAANKTNHSLRVRKHINWLARHRLKAQVSGCFCGPNGPGNVLKCSLWNLNGV